MAIRKRTPKNIDDETPKSKEVPVPFEFSTWKEQACYVLDELEKSGINIYDESRTPGMYLRLRHNRNRIIPKKLVSTFKQVSEVSSPTPTESAVSPNLLNFFKSQNNG